ncbi:DUF3618 domain-containing protein [Leifsonia sp. F6_8S_P_1B]|uniref:DUF3618 domain-containing protein n=1 Tax=Leifsonia williamsii TaxID=3035919 RepID=A0ABT8K945_9MICO|nr:DUF3618 domain-containing protein [Leifsonia williamsii]MDN4613986.1 DUF3618 domain-containing protein [Leifsonia williamsii]
MSDDPDVIRANIEATRRDLSGDVDALADKVTPSKIADRQVRKVKGAFHSLSEKVMGSDDDDGYGTGSGHRSPGELASDAGDKVSEVGHRAVAKAQGNPLAVGLIAFGVGALVASLIPPSQKEQELAADVKEKAQPLVQEVQGVAKQVADDLKEPAQQAAQQVKETAQEAASTVKDEAQTKAGEVKDEAQGARERVQGDS